MPDNRKKFQGFWGKHFIFQSVETDKTDEFKQPQTIYTIVLVRWKPQGYQITDAYEAEFDKHEAMSYQDYPFRQSENDIEKVAKIIKDKYTE